MFQHVFGLGLAVRKQNWRQGIGRAMMVRFEIEAKKVRHEAMLAPLAPSVAFLSSISRTNLHTLSIPNMAAPKADIMDQ